MGSLKPGSLPGFQDSMAQAIEEAFARTWRAHRDTPVPEAAREERRLLFIAIAQGVVQHLHDHANAFDVAVSTTQQEGEQIESSVTRNRSAGQEGRALQRDGAGNRVRSTGTGTVTINVEDPAIP